jgi:hypothetical protein
MRPNWGFLVLKLNDEALSILHLGFLISVQLRQIGSSTWGSSLVNCHRICDCTRLLHFPHCKLTLGILVPFPAAKNYGAQGYGVELDAALFAEAERAVAKESLKHLITLERKDAFTVDLTKATVVTLYLSTKGNARLLPMMRQQLPPGARVVSFCWPFEALEPSTVIKVDGISLYLYRFN